MQSDVPLPAKPAGDPFDDIFGPLTNAEIKLASATKGASGASPAKAAAVAVVVPPARPLLRLRETWRAEAEGGRVLRCALDGEVTWAEDATKDPVGGV